MVSAQVDEEANELISWFFSRRLAKLYALALQMPRWVLCPFTGNGGVVEPGSFELARRLTWQRC